MVTTMVVLVFIHDLLRSVRTKDIFNQDLLQTLTQTLTLQVIKCSKATFI